VSRLAKRTLFHRETTRSSWLKISSDSSNMKMRFSSRKPRNPGNTSLPNLRRFWYPSKHKNKLNKRSRFRLRQSSKSQLSSSRKILISNLLSNLKRTRKTRP
jgi:hypothetical protein